MTVTPAAELRAAAGRLRELAADASPGPWYADHPEPRYWGYVPESSLLAAGKPFAHMSQEYNGPLNADYAAALHPGVGVALASLLDARAECIEEDPHGPLTVTDNAALAVARALGGAK